jgi:YHS domain-containing protein
MQLDEKTAPARINYQGRDYQFCSQDCKRQFETHPQRYIQPQAQGGMKRETGGGAA